MFDKKRIMALVAIVIIGVILGRLAFRGFLNLLMGGTLLGGNLLWVRRKEEKECLYKNVK